MQFLFSNQKTQVISFGKSIDASSDGRFQRDLHFVFAERLQKLLEIVTQTFVPQVGVLVVVRQRERARRQWPDYSV